MDIPPRDAVKNIPFIIIGIWPAVLLTLWVRDHTWGWDHTPQEIMELWERGLFVSFSLAILIELGVKMFIALAERRRRIEQAREEGRIEGRKEGRAEALAEARAKFLAEARDAIRSETGDMLAVLNAAARTNPDLLPALLQEYQEKYQNGSAAA